MTVKQLLDVILDVTSEYEEYLDGENKTFIHIIMK